MNQNLLKIWALSKKNIDLYIKSGPVLIFGLMFPFFMTLSWVIGRNLSLNYIFIGIVSMTSFFTATAISPVVLPIETREKSLERILTAPISFNYILLGIVFASAIYSIIITSIIAIIFIIAFSIFFETILHIFLLGLGIVLMAFLGSLIGLAVAAYPSDKTADIMVLTNLVKFPLLFISGIFIALSDSPPMLLYIAVFSPLTYLTDLLRNSVDGNNFFTYSFDLLILLVWIVCLFILNYFLHYKTMSRRFAEKSSA